jgi:predicted nucleotidyltransferase
VALSSADIRTAFDALSNEFERAGERAEFVVVGGAALVLLYDARETTKDVDAVFLIPEASKIRSAAERVAQRLDLPADWLNDGAKGYMVQLTTGETLYESQFLIVRAASLPQLLAMKLSAWRDSVDREDARLLLSRMSGSSDHVWQTVKPFLFEHQLGKASYAFDDLWEALHGPA